MVGYLQVESVDKIYGNMKALDSVTLNFDGGRVVTLVGMNGAGKTTLLRILAGLEEPSKGNILFNHKEMKTRDLRRISTLVFQKTVMFHTSVYENVAFGLKVRDFRRKEIERRVSQELASMRLAGFRRRKARKLSGGEQQRVALARAFVLESEILLLDEPTANLDPANAIIIENAIKKMKERGACTIILATHNLHQAKRLSDTIVHLHYGRILEVASPEDFFTYPSNEVTKKFIDGELQF